MNSKVGNLTRRRLEFETDVVGDAADTYKRAGKCSFVREAGST
jgi:hypothetical protein